MNFFYGIFLVILATTIIIPSVYGQIPGEVSKQKSIEIKINSKGEVNVTHVIKPQNLPYQLELINGTISNLTVKDENGGDVQYGSFNTSDEIMILPSRDDLIVEYELRDVLQLKNNVWTWDFRYLESISFIFPEEVDLVFVNDRPAFLGEKNGIKCHGCQMKLEYSLNEPKLFEKIKIQEREFLIEIRSWALVENFKFDKTSKTINFEIVGENNFVTTVIPLEFISEPYQVSINNERIFFREFINNGTHSWVNFKPQSSGEVSIEGVVSPEIEILLEQEFPYEYVVIGIIISGIMITVVLIKKKK